AADVGILAMSLALGPHMRAAGHFWTIPREAYPPIEQGGIILKRTANASAARALRDFMQTEQGRLILGRFGYAPPAGGGNGSWTGKPSG
ncbi:MAG: substrate-binding domain-containing protein, partial [Lysobacterales bacterium]